MTCNPAWAHLPSTIFSLDVQWLYALSLIIVLLDEGLPQVWQLIRARPHMQKFACISLVHKNEINWFSCFTNCDICAVWIKSKKKNLLTLSGITAVSRMLFFLFFSLLKIMLLLITSGITRSLCLRFILKFYFIRISDSTFQNLFFTWIL